MTRRSVLETLGVAVAGALSLGHTPYRQWLVYRQSRVILLTSAEDEPAFALAEAIAALLVEHWPESRATVARARETVDVMKLLASRQLDTALLRVGDAADASVGRGRFADVGPVTLTAIAVVGTHVLVCRDDVPAARAHVLARTLAEKGAALPVPVAAVAAAAPVPLHPGARDYHEGRPSPR